MIRIDALWLCTQPLDMRAGPERLLAAVVQTLGQARAHHGYLFANARATRIKLLVHDSFWLPITASAPALELTREQFDALVLGLPWQRLPEMGVITRV
jgi:transposase